MSKSKELTVPVITEDQYPKIYKTGGLDQFYDQAKKAVEGEVADLGTAAGRKRIASLAAKISSSKTAVEKPGRAYNKILKTKTGKIDAELKNFVDRMNDLRDETRKPLTDWENIEKKRIEDIDSHIVYITDLKTVLNPETGQPLTAAELKEKLAEVKAIEVTNGEFAEFTERACEVQCNAIDFFENAITQREQYETDQAEIARLKAESDERDRKEREEEIRRKATEDAKKESEQKVRDAEIEAQRVKDNAESEKLKAISDERDRVQAENDEADREAAQAKREDDQRKANREHQRTINNLTLNELCKFGGITNMQAQLIVEALVRKQFTHTTINYQDCTP